MRSTMIVLLGLGVGLSGVAQAQTARTPAAKNTPEGIVCAMTGSCAAVGGTEADGRMSVGDEKAFSLARPSGPAPATPARSVPVRAYAPARGYVAPTRSRGMAATAMGRAPVPAARLAADGGLDMQVTFDRGSADLTSQAKIEAKAFATAMAAPQMAGRSFAIEGHTDSSGAHDKNVDLSQRRAQSVVDYLVAQGVESGRLSAKGYGPDKPLPGKSAAAPANRRVEFVKS